MLSANETFHPVISNYQSAVATGRLELISDDDVLNSIVGLYETYKRVEYNSQNIDHFWFDLREGNKHFFRTRELNMDIEELETLKNDLFLFKDDLNWYTQLCSETHNEVEFLIEKL